MKLPAPFRSRAERLTKSLRDPGDEVPLKLLTKFFWPSIMLAGDQEGPLCAVAAVSGACSYVHRLASRNMTHGHLGLGLFPSGYNKCERQYWDKYLRQAKYETRTWTSTSKATEGHSTVFAFANLPLDSR